VGKIEELCVRGNVDLTTNIGVYDAAIKSTILHGIDSLRIKEDLNKRMSIQGPGQMFKIRTTYGQIENEGRTWTYNNIMALINVKTHGKRKLEMKTMAFLEN